MECHSASSFPVRFVYMKEQEFELPYSEYSLETTQKKYLIQNQLYSGSTMCYLSKSRPVQLAVCEVPYSGAPPHFNQTKKYINHMNQYFDYNKLMKDQVVQHRNKCQSCFKSTGKFILQCYCFLCSDCFARLDKNSNVCSVCFKPTSGKFIDTRDRESMHKVNYLFTNLQSTLNRCMDIYRFQSQIDLRYCKYLQVQLLKYKELLNSLVRENPGLGQYVRSFFARKTTNYRSISQHMPERYPHHDGRGHQAHTERSVSVSGAERMHHQRLIDGHQIRQGDKNYSAKINYKVPNVNFNTALRSSKRPKPDDEDFYYQKREKR